MSAMSVETTTAAIASCRSRGSHGMGGPADPGFPEELEPSTITESV
jgi:hypothetical protein